MRQAGSVSYRTIGEKAKSKKCKKKKCKKGGRFSFDLIICYYSTPQSFDSLLRYKTTEGQTFLFGSPYWTNLENWIGNKYSLNWKVSISLLVFFNQLNIGKILLFAVSFLKTNQLV